DLSAVLEADVMLYDGTAGSRMHEAVDVVFESPGHCYIEYATYTPALPNSGSQVVVERRATTGSFALDWFAYARQDFDFGNADFYGRTYTHGGLVVTPGGEGVTWFAHDAGEAVITDFDHVRDPNTGLHHGRMAKADGNKIGTDRFLPHHRLATRPAYFDGTLYAAVQQWTDMTPYTPNVGAYNANAAVWGAVRPRTTVLVAFDQASNVARPVAYFDAGQSKTNEYAESEWAVHCPRLWVDDGNIVLPNRVVVYAEDLSLNMSDVPLNLLHVPPSPATAARFGNAESPSDAMARIHRVAKGSADIADIDVATFGDGAVLSAAVPLWFDGRFFGEFGPIDSPEIISVTDARMEEETLRPRISFDPDDAQAPTLSRWTKMQVVIGYYDASGNKHRSAPSTVVYVDDLSGVDASPDIPGNDVSSWRGKEVTVYITLPLSVLPADLEYFAEIYACPGDESAPQLVDTTTITLDQTPSYSDVSARTQLVRYRGQSPSVFVRPVRTSRSIYTAGGELPADPWPAFTRSVVTSTRMLALDAVNSGKVLVSKLFDDFQAPEYNALLDINLGDERDLLCIGKLDDKTVIFEKDDIHVIYGDGPQNDGSGEDFAVHYISTDVGCEDQQSIVECPAGLVFFRRERGFYLLDRSLNIKYIGGKVYDLSKGIEVVAAELVSSEGEVRFLCAVTGPQMDEDGWDPGAGTTRPPRPRFGNAAPASDFALVWSYEKDQWSVFSDYPGVASAIYQGEYTRLLPDWTILQERANTSFDYRDPTVAPRTLIRTPWIPIADGAQGYSRVHRMNVLGRYLSSLAEYSPGVYDACDIQVKVWYDYEEGPGVTPQTKLFKFQDFGFDPFSKRNLRAERLQFTVTPAEGRGRCQAVKLEFEEMVPAETLGTAYALGQGFEVSAIDFEIGVDQRVTRHLPAAVLK
ncbi:MAG TPA: hypothetical protein VM487_00520, partial [Phycisphaerae bacterium]|nr:hypothetical protein [Phycisphaerae bacterium]